SLPHCHRIPWRQLLISARNAASTWFIYPLEAIDPAFVLDSPNSTPSLPAEITLEIFQSCVDVSSESYLDTATVLPGPDLAPLLLLQICRQWREIALSNPLLWRSLHIMEDVPTELIDTWFARAGDLPLQYHLQNHNPSEEIISSLLKNSLLYASRWEDVRFIIPISLVPEFDLGSQSFPHLRKFALDTHPVGPMNTLNASTAVPIGDAPLLGAVRLSNILPTMQLDFPWAQLTDLKLHGMDIARCLSIVAGCLQLQHLEAFTTGASVTQPLLTLPTVQSISSTSSENCLLQYVILPQLHKLVLHGSTTDQHEHVEGARGLGPAFQLPAQGFSHLPCHLL
ncbi:hypothetical protein FB45DRAFT_482768, partial [Roridomyces roridus]